MRLTGKQRMQRRRLALGLLACSAAAGPALAIDPPDFLKSASHLAERSVSLVAHSEPTGGVRPLDERPSVVPMTPARVSLAQPPQFNAHPPRVTKRTPGTDEDAAVEPIRSRLSDQIDAALRSTPGAVAASNTATEGIPSVAHAPMWAQLSDHRPVASAAEVARLSDEFAARFEAPLAAEFVEIEAAVPDLASIDAAAEEPAGGLYEAASPPVTLLAVEPPVLSVPPLETAEPLPEKIPSAATAMASLVDDRWTENVTANHSAAPAQPHLPPINNPSALDQPFANHPSALEHAGPSPNDFVGADNSYRAAIPFGQIKSNPLADAPLASAAVTSLPQQAAPPTLVQATPLTAPRHPAIPRVTRSTETVASAQLASDGASAWLIDDETPPPQLAKIVHDPVLDCPVESEPRAEEAQLVTTAVSRMTEPQESARSIANEPIPRAASQAVAQPTGRAPAVTRRAASVPSLAAVSMAMPTARGTETSEPTSYQPVIVGSTSRVWVQNAVGPEAEHGILKLASAAATPDRQSEELLAPESLEPQFEPPAIQPAGERPATSPQWSDPGRSIEEATLSLPVPPPDQSPAPNQEPVADPPLPPADAPALAAPEVPTPEAPTIEPPMMEAPVDEPPAMLAETIAPQAPVVPFPETGLHAGDVRVTAADSCFVAIGGTVSQIQVEHGTICHAISWNVGRLLVMGTAPGRSRVAVWYEGAKLPTIYNVEVLQPYAADAARQQDYDQLARSLERMFPGSELAIAANGEGLVVSGRAANSQDASKILRLVRRSNLVPVVDALQTNW
jgi:hypothetical protein